ncbi:hypothetical protein Nocox_20435 [Nonomuraea coxensis DSM 45129]|uniref:SHOCT domain-containing protein n=1 Tax=Nonomuraea coxensis DSM 45129 TaxID=1122611 RepID=A0ABX8U2M4_9ACTN|nr:SHOCT domain-containing protein [Nonomuraea coxensis]QYC41696.1 hypothetical protein Nocox_20435 [Nonomuraea coxensis DSM 45129]
MYGDGGGWIWVIFMSLLWIVLIGLVVWAVIRLTQGGSSGGRYGGHPREHGESPEEILDRRYASGEIDAETYTEARERLAAHRPRAR